MIKVAINGFGRIGRIAFRQMIVDADFDIVAINDLTGAEDLAYLLKYDTNHRSFHEDEITFEGDEIVIAGKKRVKVFAEKDPANLPWGELGVDLVLECTGLFTDKEKASAHITAGAKKVLISAPAKGDLTGASCTTNCLAPVLNLINKEFGIEKGFMTTVHAYTNDQATLDIAHKKGIKARRGRACAANIVPASTGAASAIGLVIPDLLGKLDGNAMRVPVSDGSIIDVTLELKKNTTVEEINKVFENNRSETIDITYDPVVSSDILGKKLGALVDGLSTNVITVNDKQLVKILAWYDNEYGYTAQMLRTAKVLFR